MENTSCGWRSETGCERDAKDGNTLCQEHIDEAIRLRKIKVAGWAAAEEERIEKYAFILSAFTTAYQDAIMAVVDNVDDVRGDSEVVIGHSRTNSQVYNVLMGTTKVARVPQPGWESPKYVNGAINRIASGLSVEAATVFANEYNATLSRLDIDNTTAIVS